MKLEERGFESEFSFKTSRSSGKGGQHVNKTETRVELIFDVANTTLLTDAEKAKVLDKLSTYINAEQVMRLSSEETRSQASNKEKVVEKFYTLMHGALKREKKRIPTKVPKQVKEKILEKKKITSEKKQGRNLKTRDFL